MIHLRKLLIATVLTFVLAGAAPAEDGIIYGGLMPNPSPTPAAPRSVTGDEPTPGESPDEEMTTTEIVIQSALRVLGDMLLLY